MGKTPRRADPRSARRRNAAASRVRQRPFPQAVRAQRVAESGRRKCRRGMYRIPPRRCGPGSPAATHAPPQVLGHPVREVPVSDQVQVPGFHLVHVERPIRQKPVPRHMADRTAGAVLENQTGDGLRPFEQGVEVRIRLEQMPAVLPSRVGFAAAEEFVEESHGAVFLSANVAPPDLVSSPAADRSSPALRRDLWWWSVFALLVADRCLELLRFGFVFCDQDQAILWHGANEAVALRIHEPRWYGQDYNSMLESWLAAPAVARRHAAMSRIRKARLSLSVSGFFLSQPPGS